MPPLILQFNGIWKTKSGESELLLLHRQDRLQMLVQQGSQTVVSRAAFSNGSRARAEAVM